MTCIVGIVEDDKVFLGGDTAGCNVAYYQVYTIKSSKVFKNKDFVMGSTGTFRMLQLLQYKFKPPVYRKDETSLMEYMVNDFVDELRDCFKKAGIATELSKVEYYEGKFLVGFQGHLFCIGSDYDVFEIRDNYFCVGCGEDYARGSLFSTDSTELGASERILLALKAASKFSAYVKGPYNIISSDGAFKEYE